VSAPDERDFILDVLSRGDLTVTGRITQASNATLFAEVVLDGVATRCVYKPVAGERPLWDFPTGTLADREVAAFVVSDAGGWNVVPPTVMRDGPVGVGSVQQWIDQSIDPGQAPDLVDIVPAADRETDTTYAGWHTVLQAEDQHGDPVVLVHADHPDLRTMSVFDVVANNTDRKAGHILRDATGAVHGVDHGLTFHDENKLRTVLWGWAGQRLTDDALTLLERTEDALRRPDVHDELDSLLTVAEITALRQRTQLLQHHGRHPRPGPGHPPIPWPPF